MVPERAERLRVAGEQVEIEFNDRHRRLGRVISAHRSHRPLERRIDDAVQARKAGEERSQRFAVGGRYFGQHASPC